MIALLYVLLAIFALSFLIFIHELGHYIMARRVGMRVETFSIGFGKPLVSWIRDGVKWQIGWLPLGGFVKIAGMSTESDEDPTTIPDGFYAKTPLARLKVAAMGPIVNLAFAFLAFTLIWFMGGRDKNFSEYTSKIGWVDEHSELFRSGIRPGDEVVSFDGNSFSSSRDHIFVAIAGDDEITIKGNRVDYATGDKTPFEETVKRYPDPDARSASFQTTGITKPASYVIYDRFPSGQDNPLPEGSPLVNSGIQYGDRVFWVDGEIIFSLKHLSDVLNDGRALLTVQKGGETVLRRVPRVQVQELRPDSEFREEIIDWQFEGGLTAPFHTLFMIPYNISFNGVVENRLHFLDNEAEATAFPKHFFSSLDEPLEPGDRILAVDGTPINHASQLLTTIQEKRVHLIVERDSIVRERAVLQEADREFVRPTDVEHVQIIAKGIGIGDGKAASGPFVLLSPVAPKKQIDFFQTDEKKQEFLAAVKFSEEEIAKEKDRDKRLRAEHQLELQKERLLLGFGSQDRTIEYNPPPTVLFADVVDEISRTLSALLTGALSPKYMSGPIGIVYSVQQESKTSLLEALYWLGLISLNLGVLNLLPIPILDGGTIVFCALEMVTGKRLKPQTMEKLIIPFAVLLICFFVYVSYHDIFRYFGNFLNW